MPVQSAEPPDASASLLTTHRPDGAVVLLTCNDLHLTDVPPAARTDNYVDELFGLLSQVATAAAHTHATAVCIAGDIFHSKDRPMGSALLGRLVDWCRQLHAHGTAVWVVAGNHDLRYGQLATLHNQPLGLLIRAGMVVDVAATPTYCRHVQVVGVPFPDAMDLDGWRLRAAGVPNHHRRVVLAHCFASPNGGEVYGEAEHGYADVYEALPADVYVFGHDHSDGGIATLAAPDRTAHFINLGAVSRGTIGHDDIARDIHIGLVTIPPIGPATCQRVRLNAIPASALFDLDAKAAQMETQRQIDAFVASLEATLAALDTARPVEQHLQGLAIATDVRQRMQRYIAEVQG